MGGRENVKQKLMKFMMGRYGVDSLNSALQIASMVLLMLSMAFRPVYPLALAMIMWASYRMFSKNIAKRRAECIVYERYMGIVKQKLDMLKKLTLGTKDQRYFKCPSCKQVVRVPKGHGKKTIRCPKCEGTFARRT